MIISHKYKFIFIKTAKTAGTSIELGLSRYCGEFDVITPCSVEDEQLRKQIGGRCAQNFRIPLRKYSLTALAYALENRRRVGFFNHSSAALVRKYTDPHLWRSYFKFCFERNPWDKAVSQYYFQAGVSSKLAVSDFIARGGCNNIAGYDHYTINGDVVVDKVFLYEDIGSALEEIAQRVGLPEPLLLPRAKGRFRPANTHYRDVLSDAAAQTIARVYAREIVLFGYKW